MLHRAGFLVVAALAALAVLGVVQAQNPGKVVTLTPSSGPPGTVVTAELSGAKPGVALTVIFQIPGDPIVATGTTDANGEATFTFTVPYVPGGGTWPVFFTDFACACQISVPFTVINARPTNTPTPTAPVPPPTVTPTVSPPTVTPTPPPGATLTPTPTAAPATPNPTATPTPAVPFAGTGSSMGGPGPNIGILALGAIAVITVLTWFGATRRSPGSLAVAYVEPYGPDEYSTEIDAATLDALRARDAFASTTSQSRGHGIGWALGAGIGAIAGVLWLRRK